MIPKWWEDHFLGYELALAGAVGVCVWVCSVTFAGSYIDSALNQNRSAVYGTLASILASLLGFVIAAIAIVLPAMDDSRLGLLRASGHDRTLWRVFFSATKVLAVGTIMAMSALLIDRDSGVNRVLVAMVSGFAFLACLRVARVIWILDKLVYVLTHHVDS
jgi:hypothetical protein